MGFEHLQSGGITSSLVAELLTAEEVLEPPGVLHLEEAFSSIYPQQEVWRYFRFVSEVKDRS